MAIESTLTKPMTTPSPKTSSSQRSHKKSKRRRRSSRGSSTKRESNSTTAQVSTLTSSDLVQQVQTVTQETQDVTPTATQVDVSKVAAQSKTRRRRGKSTRTAKLADQSAVKPQEEQQANSTTRRSRRSRRSGSRIRKTESTESTQPAATSPPDPATDTDSMSLSEKPMPQRPARRPSKQEIAKGEKTAARSRRSTGSKRNESKTGKSPSSDHEFTPARIGTTLQREMVINVSGKDECRIAILCEGRLEELFIERASSQSHVGNIYKGIVTNVESSIQAAFIDFGLPKNGFLHISDIQPQYFPGHHIEHEDVGRKIPRHHRPPIQKCFKRGQEVIVQITKEGVGTKGPTLTTYLSIPGRYIVMMPGMSKQGVSRKIEDEADRRSMRDSLKELDLPSGMGFILRTAGLGRPKRDLQRDLNYLTRLWKNVIDCIKSAAAPAELYRESDLVTRTIRDCYTNEFHRILIDDIGAARKAKELLHLAMPRLKPNIELYSEPEPLFHRMNIESEIERINMRHVPLRSGGSLVIDSTEALVAIDVNSGRFRSPDDAEETAVKLNVEAAEEIARQLRLRDLGGLIVCDFIDMRMEKNKRKVERALRDALKQHKERAKTLRMSAFGLIEITRQRQGPSIKRNIYFDCPHCLGAGVVKMPESVMLDVMRVIKLTAHRKDVHKVTVTVASDVAYQLLNTKRTAIATIENDTGKEIIIMGDASFTSDQIDCVCEDSRGRTVTISPIHGEKKRS